MDKHVHMRELREKIYGQSKRKTGPGKDPVAKTVVTYQPVLMAHPESTEQKEQLLAKGFKQSWLDKLVWAPDMTVDEAREVCKEIENVS